MLLYHNYCKIPHFKSHPPPQKKRYNSQNIHLPPPQNQKTKISIFTRSCLLRFEILPAQHFGFQHFQYCHGEFYRYRRTGLRLTLRRAGACRIAAWRQHGRSGSGAEESTGSDGRGSLRSLKPFATGGWWWMDYEGFMCFFWGGGVSGGWAGELEKVTVLVFFVRGWD